MSKIISDLEKRQFRIITNKVRRDCSYWDIEGLLTAQRDSSDKERTIKEEMMASEFIPTIGNMIVAIDSIIKDAPPNLRKDYARMFDGTEIQKLLFSTRAFGEAACEYCRNTGWKEPR